MGSAAPITPNKSKVICGHTPLPAAKKLGLRDVHARI